MQTRQEDICDIEGELHYFNPERVRFSLNEFDDLTVELEKGVTHSPLILRRAFPLTMEDQYIAVKKVEGDELGIIRKVSDLDPDSQHVLYAQLNMVYFAPRIIRINSIKSHLAINIWDVETNKGRTVFEAENTHNDIRIMKSGRIIIYDADRNRYEIPDYRKLDDVSRALVEAQI